jgi:hypothetical protein
MSLEQRYEAAQSTSDANVAYARRACAEFIRRHPWFATLVATEEILFADVLRKMTQAEGRFR